MRGVVRHLGHRPVVLEGWRRVVRNLEIPVQIVTQGRVRWNFVVDTFNQAVRAKYKNVAFHTPR